MLTLNPLGRLMRNRFGGLADEFALVATPLVILLLGTMELGRGLWLQNALNHSVEEAARCASIDVNNCSTQSQIKSYAAARSGASFATTVFTPSTASCGNLVTASYPMSIDIPFASVSITLTAQSCYPK
jgi:Flp pilus assembly protein TadG